MCDLLQDVTPPLPVPSPDEKGGGLLAELDTLQRKNFLLKSCK